MANKDKLLATAQKYISKGQIPKAIGEYRKLVDAFPKDVRSRQKLAELLGRDNKNEDALAEYEVVAKHYTETGFYLKAIALFKQMQKIDASRVDIYHRLAELNEKQGPMVIISASGMAEGGRILHHLKNNVGNPRNLVLFVGYAAEHTLARKIMDGAKEVNIFGEKNVINCKVKIMDYFSAHADQGELIEYIRLNPKEMLKNIFLVHGEEDQSLVLREKLVTMGYRNVHFPVPGEKIEI